MMSLQIYIIIYGLGTLNLGVLYNDNMLCIANWTVMYIIMVT